MSKLTERDADLLGKEWRALQTSIDAEARQVLAELVSLHAGALVQSFYAELEKDEDSRTFLSQSLIRSRLSGSLQNWLLALFPAQGVPDFAAMAEVQLHVGAIHARIGLALKLVTRGHRLMTEELINIIIAQGGSVQSRRSMLRVAASTLSIAIDIMSTAYVQADRRNEKSAEAFRLFALGKNLSQERESQRAAMAEWLQEAMFVIASRERLDTLSDLHSSEFGLWLAHRGSVLFEGTREMERAMAIVDHIDGTVLPCIRQGRDLREMLTELNADATEIRSLIMQCFNEASRLEGGHDALTGVLSRRFMDAILSREVDTARRRRKKFSVALIDLDHFKRINDQYGHGAGDQALRHCAEMISQTMRAGDFLFRYGGEEFLLTLAEMDRPEAEAFANHLLEEMRERPITLPDGQVITLTASIGVAEFQDEPDFHRLIKAADQALYEAKHRGRDRVHMAI